MKAQWLILAVLCAFLACEEDPVMQNEAPESALTGMATDPEANKAMSVQGSYFVLPPGAPARPAGPVFDVRYPLIDSPDAVVQAVARAYILRDPYLLASILANDPERNAGFLFFLSPTGTGETQWGYTEEARIHQRMFHPEDPLPGDPPVPANLWLQSIQITLTPFESFGERQDLYSENHGADGKLDPDIWKASDALYSTYVLFDLAGSTDYKVEGEANFVVVEDRTKQVGESGKFLIYIWEELAPPTKGAVAAVQSATWSGVKQLYR